MRGLGRLLQLVGLILLPLAMLMQLGGQISAGKMLQFAIAGVCCFGIGYILMTYRWK